MDNTNKYLNIKQEGKNVYELVDSMNGKSPLFIIKKIREFFPYLSLIEAKEIVIIGTTQHKSLYDYQGDLFPDLEEAFRIIDDEN